ncbi:MAG: hypothetical protein K8H84_07810 [Sulfuricella denitrificans]|nr:hypothetical protein [Sulfuricella denitrificans]
MGKLLALWQLFRRGEEIANAAAWKNGTITVNALAALVLSMGTLAASFGLDLGLNDAMAAQIGGGLLAIGNVIMHVVTSRKVGLPAGGENRNESTAANSVAGQDNRPFLDREM